MKCSITTDQGEFIAQFTSRGLARLQFPGTSDEPTVDSSPPPRSWLRQTRSALSSILNGTPPKVLPPLDLSGGTKFQQQLWRALLRIPAGRTRSYGELARTLRRPKAARAIGQACGANPIPVIVPCHRVLAGGGRLGGFSGGLNWKRKLLEIEDAPFNESQ